MNILEIARLIDISTVRSDSTVCEIEKIIELAEKYHLICVFVNPSMMGYVKERVSLMPDVFMGGVVGFPSGGDTTTSKVFQANEMKALGCGEIDMVLNVGKLKSGLLDEVKEDILSVLSAVSPTPLKVIMEVALLTDEEIVSASKIIKECGCAFIKTGTGWHGATTIHHVKLIKDTVGDTIPLKVAGGVRSLATLLEMNKMGVARFGIGYSTVVEIMKEAEAQEKL